MKSSKHLLILSSIVSLLLFGITPDVVAQPIAPLAPLNSMGKQMFSAEGKTEEDARNDIPSKEMVGLPAYPNTYFSGAMGDESALISVSLMSKDSAAAVISWYKKNLSDEWQNMPELATKELNEVAVFIKSDKKNISAMGSLKYQQIRISKVEKPEDTGFASMAFDVTGIKSMINMTVKPMM